MTPSPTPKSEAPAALDRAASVANEAVAAFRAAENEIFEDGSTSRFARHLTNLITRHGALALASIRQLLRREEIAPEIKVEALHALGHIDSPRTRDDRLFLIAGLLGDEDQILRDGAAIGLVYLQDKRGIAILEKAAGREPIASLRSDLLAAAAEAGVGVKRGNRGSATEVARPS